MWVGANKYRDAFPCVHSSSHHSPCTLDIRPSFLPSGRAVHSITTYAASSADYSGPFRPVIYPLSVCMWFGASVGRVRAGVLLDGFQAAQRAAVAQLNQTQGDAVLPGDMLRAFTTTVLDFPNDGLR